MILRWLETLGNNNFTVVHREGEKHGNADALSRCEHSRDPTALEEAEAEEEMVASIQSLTPANSLEPEMIRQHQEADADLRVIRKWVRQGQKPWRADIRGRSLDYASTSAFSSCYTWIKKTYYTVERRKASSSKWIECAYHPACKLWLYKVATRWQADTWA